MSPGLRPSSRPRIHSTGLPSLPQHHWTTHPAIATAIARAFLLKVERFSDPLHFNTSFQEHFSADKDDKTWGFKFNAFSEPWHNHFGYCFPPLDHRTIDRTIDAAHEALSSPSPARNVALLPDLPHWSIQTRIRDTKGYIIASFPARTLPFLPPYHWTGLSPYSRTQDCCSRYPFLLVIWENKAAKRRRPIAQTNLDRLRAVIHTNCLMAGRHVTLRLKYMVAMQPPALLSHPASKHILLQPRDRSPPVSRAQIYVGPNDQDWAHGIIHPTFVKKLKSCTKLSPKEFALSLTHLTQQTAIASRLLWNDYSRQLREWLRLHDFLEPAAHRLSLVPASSPPTELQRQSRKEDTGRYLQKLLKTLPGLRRTITRTMTIPEIITLIQSHSPTLPPPLSPIPNIKNIH